MTGGRKDNQPVVRMTIKDFSAEARKSHMSHLSLAQKRASQFDTRTLEMERHSHFQRHSVRQSAVHATRQSMLQLVEEEDETTEEAQMKAGAEADVQARLKEVKENAFTKKYPKVPIVICSNEFESFLGLMISINCILIGVEVQLCPPPESPRFKGNGEHSELCPRDFLVPSEHFFTAFFLNRIFPANCSFWPRALPLQESE